MKNLTLGMIVIGCFTLIAGLLGVEPTYAQVRIPPTSVAALASQSDDRMSVPESETVPSTALTAPKVTPIQYAATPQVQPQATLSQQLASQPVAPQQVVPQVQSQLQAATPQLSALPQTMAQPVMIPEGMNGVIVIPVVATQYVTYPPPPVTMMVNRPAQLMIPQYPAPMMPPMIDPMAMQMMQSQMMMQQQMMPVMQPQIPAQQPIPVKMLLPDGSTISIKHYMPGQFFKNAVRAVTP